MVLVPRDWLVVIVLVMDGRLAVGIIVLMTVTKCPASHIGNIANQKIFSRGNTFSAGYLVGVENHFRFRFYNRKYFHTKREKCI